MMQMMKDIGGVEMPEYFGRLVGDEPRSDDSGADTEDAAGDEKSTDTKAPPAPKPAG